MGRFVNADGYVSTGQGQLGYNMYAYCLNDPVRYADPSGSIAGVDDAVILVGLGIVALGSLVLLPEGQDVISSGADALAQGLITFYQN